MFSTSDGLIIILKSGKPFLLDGLGMAKTDVTA